MQLNFFKQVFKAGQLSCQILNQESRELLEKKRVDLQEIIEAEPHNPNGFVSFLVKHFDQGRQLKCCTLDKQGQLLCFQDESKDHLKTLVTSVDNKVHLQCLLVKGLIYKNYISRTNLLLSTQDDELL